MLTEQLSGGPAWVAAALGALCLAQAAVNFAESSISSLSVARLKSLKALYGGPFWLAAQRWLSHPEEYLTILLLLNNLLEAAFAWLAIIVASWFFTEALERDMAVWILGGFLNLTLLNIMPKVLGRRLSHGIFGVWILRALRALLTPLYPFFQAFFWLLRRISGGTRGGTALGRGVYLSFEEIRELINEAKDGGSATEFQGTSLVAKYLRLKDVKVRDVMTPRPRVSCVSWESLQSAPPSSPQFERLVFSLMTDGYSRTLVLKGGVPCGYIHAKDLLRHIVAGNPASPLFDVELSTLMRPIPTVHADQKLINMLPLLLHQTPVACVIDDAAWVGLISAEDFLEEITGEILDEFEHRKRIKA